MTPETQKKETAASCQKAEPIGFPQPPDSLRPAEDQNTESVPEPRLHVLGRLSRSSVIISLQVLEAVSVVLRLNISRPCRQSREAA